MSNKNKSVEEVNVRQLPYWWEDYKRAVAPSNGEDKEDVPSLIRRLLQQERQTSQEREREIVLEAIRLSDEAERGNETEFNEWRAFKGFRNGLRDWAKEKGITNPNKD